MADRIRSIFGGAAASSEVQVLPLDDKENRIQEKTDHTQFALIFDGQGFEKTQVKVNIVAGKKIQIVATRLEQMDEKWWLDETVFYTHVIPPDVDANSINANWLEQKKKLVITAQKAKSKR